MLLLSFILALLATFHSAVDLRPQLRELDRKLHLPEFQRTVHHQAMQSTFDRLSRRYARLRQVSFFFWFLTGILGLARFLFR